MNGKEELKRQKEILLKQLGEIEKKLGQSESNADTGTNNNPAVALQVEKSGYLYKWQDRTIGWTGTKWDLRFVRLERGRLSYYRTHTDPSPRYMLTLRNCAVRDDGLKKNKRFWKRSANMEVDIQTPGAYFHVFSIYHRTEGDDDAGEEKEDLDIVPLLRFSTQSYAEKSLWIEQLSEACAFCDTDEFAKYEQELKDNNASIHSDKETLPPMIFAPPPPAKIKRYPSNSNIKRRKGSYVTLNTLKDAPKSHTQQKSGYAPSRPMHRSASPSYLSDEAPMQNYRGLLNLGIIILVISNFRILLGTMAEYGNVIMIDWIKPMENPNTYWKAATMVDFPLLSGFGFLFIFVNFAYSIELFTSRKVWAEWFGVFLHIINSFSALIFPTAIVWYKMDSVIGGVILVMCAVILWMKLISYAHANADYRNHPERCAIKSSDFIQNVDEESRAVTYPK